MTKVHEDLMTPPSSQLTASPTIVAVVSIVGVPTMTVLMNVLIWKTMGAEGRELQERITSYLLNVGVPAAITGVVGVVGRGLLLTSGKIKNQTPRDLPEHINAGTLHVDTGHKDVQDFTANVEERAPVVPDTDFNTTPETDELSPTLDETPIYDAPVSERGVL